MLDVFMAVTASEFHFKTMGWHKNSTGQGTVSQERYHYTPACNFAKCWLILNILSPLGSKFVIKLSLKIPQELVITLP